MRRLTLAPLALQLLPGPCAAANAAVATATTTGADAACLRCRGRRRHRGLRRRRRHRGHRGLRRRRRRRKLRRRRRDRGLRRRRRCLWDVLPMSSTVCQRTNSLLGSRHVCSATLSLHPRFPRSPSALGWVYSSRQCRYIPDGSGAQVCVTVCRRLALQPLQDAPRVRAPQGGLGRERRAHGQLLLGHKVPELLRKVKLGIRNVVAKDAVVDLHRRRLGRHRPFASSNSDRRRCGAGLGRKVRMCLSRRHLVAIATLVAAQPRSVLYLL